MGDVSTERRFSGSVRLVTLHLWRIAQSTDVDEGLRCARDLGMFDAESERFVRACLAADRRLAEGGDPGVPITDETVGELQRCAIRLNSADPA